MYLHPDFDPVALHLGPLAIHWYGLMYLLGFWGAWWVGTRRARLPHIQWPAERVSDLMFYGVMGVILGGRIGYMLFYAYDPAGHWLEWQDPLTIFRVWDGGMSFHGGLIGVLIAIGLFARQQHLTYFEISDFVAPLVPIGLFTGRIGNFINGELWGAPTTLPWGMVFKNAGPLPRHPSMLYEAGLEGLVMFAILIWFSAKPRPRMAVSGMFMLLYAVFRSLVEFVRVPDAQLGYLAWGWLTMGQVLCVPMFIVGAVLLVLAYRHKSQMPV